jgi:transposase
VQQEQLGRRGHRGDPLYKIRGLLRHGLEHLSERSHARLQAGLLAGDQNCEVELAWSCYQQLRAIYAGAASLRERWTLAEQVIASFRTCSIPEVARLGRTLAAGRSQVPPFRRQAGLGAGLSAPGA